MSENRRSPGSTRGFVLVVGYYVGLAVLVALVLRFAPAVADALGEGSLQALAREGSSLFGDNPPVGTQIDVGPWGGAARGAVSMLGALAIMLPVTWIYMLTRGHRGYDESVVHTLLILPVAVTGIVMIVQHSVPLAFSLAGIVAAVRFRTTLEDTKDAVYVFLAIGVGLASGVQAMGLALVISVVFNGIILVLWQTGFGNIYADQSKRSGALSWADVFAGPASRAKALRVGDPAILDAATSHDLSELAERSARMERYISEERAKKKSKRANALVVVHATSVGSAQTHVEQALEELAARWRLAEIVPGDDGRSVLEYLARFDGPAVEGAVVDRLREVLGDALVAAEVRSLKGLRRRE